MLAYRDELSYTELMDYPVIATPDCPWREEMVKSNGKKFVTISELVHCISSFFCGKINHISMIIRRNIMKRIIVCIISLVLAMSMLTACGSADVDGDALQKIVGEYQVVAVEDEDNYVGSWWHLSIMNDNDEYGDYLSIYDNEAGNPGVEGQIVALDETNIKVKIDPDYYDELPSANWKDSGDYLELTYAMTGDGIALSNNGTELHFNFDLSEEE